MRTCLLLAVVACSHPASSPPSNTGGGVIASAGWTADAGTVSVATAEAAIRGAADVAIVKLAQHGDRCMNSIADAMTVARVDGVAGTAAAIDRHTGFPATDGYLVAAVEPRPLTIAVGDDCMGEQLQSVGTPATVIAFVTLPDLDSARAEVERLVVR